MKQISSLDKIAVVRLRGTASSGGYGDATLDWANPARKSISGCHWQPVIGEEISTDRSAVISRWRWWGPLDADVTDQDRIEVDGIQYRIDGSVEEWRALGLDHKTALCRRTSG